MLGGALLVLVAVTPLATLFCFILRVLFAALVTGRRRLHSAVGTRLAPSAALRLAAEHKSND